MNLSPSIISQLFIIIRKKKKKKKHHCHHPWKMTNHGDGVSSIKFWLLVRQGILSAFDTPMEIGRCMAQWWNGVSAIFCYLVSATLLLLLALVGGALGAIIGSVIGIRSDSFLRGAAMGAIAGGLLSIEVFRLVLAFCLPDDITFRRIFPMFESATSRATRRLVRDLCNPIGIASNRSFVEERHRNGSMEKIPRKRISMRDLYDSSGKRLACSVCLQEMKYFQLVRIPSCCHQAFHRCCIDKWLVRHDSCPLCRSIILD